MEVYLRLKIRFYFATGIDIQCGHRTNTPTPTYIHKYVYCVCPLFSVLSMRKKALHSSSKCIDLSVLLCEISNRTQKLKSLCATFDIRPEDPQTKAERNL